MKTLKEIWTGDSKQEEVRTAYEYEINLRDKLESTIKIVQENLKKSSNIHVYKYYYKRKTN